MNTERKHGGFFKELYLPNLRLAAVIIAVNAVYIMALIFIYRKGIFITGYPDTSAFFLFIFGIIQAVFLAFGIKLISGNSYRKFMKKIAGSSVDKQELENDFINGILLSYGGNVLCIGKKYVFNICEEVSVIPIENIVWVWQSKSFDKNYVYGIFTSVEKLEYVNIATSERIYRIRCHNGWESYVYSVLALAAPDALFGYSKLVAELYEKYPHNFKSAILEFTDIASEDGDE